MQPPSSSTLTSQTPKVPLLSAKSPVQILSTPISEDHYFFENRIWGRGMPLAIVGPPGCGKSRLVTELMVSNVTNSSFMGLECNWPALKFLILQAENSTARLQNDLKAIRGTLNDEQWGLFDSRITIHTIDTPLDTALSLDDFWNMSNIAELVESVQPDVVVADPLEAFSPGSLNTDAAMRKTVQNFTSLAQLANPNAATLFIHHSLIGAKAIKEAAGFGRGAYAKGSKTLNAMMRGQINVVPETPDNNNRLVLLCGKNSNGPEFPPIGITLNTDTMRYEVNPGFNAPAWRETFIKSPKSKAMVSPSLIAELVQNLPMKKKDLVKVIMEEVGCQKSTAYASIDDAVGVTIKRNATREFIPIDATECDTQSEETPCIVPTSDSARNLEMEG